MKKIIFIILATVLGLMSCKKFLTLAPEYEINEINYYKSQNDFENAIVGVYSVLQPFHYDLLFLTELTTDNAEIYYWGLPTSDIECDEMGITSVNTHVANVWKYCYQIIAYSNNILVRINDVSMNEDKRNQFEGEALFLRAYGYFYLVRLFGEVPIVKVAFNSPNEIFAFDATRQPVGNVYALIEDDLKKSDSLLTNITGLGVGRASSGAAKTLLGKVLLTKGDYGNAASVLKEVIDLGTYSLCSNYSNLFTNGNDANLPESIFQTEYLSGNLGEGNSFSDLFTPYLFNMALFPNDMNGSGIITPTLDLYHAYETGDLRMAASVNDSVPLIDGTKVYARYGLKFVDFTTGILGDGGIDFTDLRYADVLLMYAEALNNTNNTASAHTYLNMVRNRVGLASLSGLSQSDFTLALEKERRVEFFCEGQRWFDLIRTGRAKTVLNAYFTSLGLPYTVEDYKLLMPIPDGEIRIDPKLTQNAGY